MPRPPPKKKGFRPPKDFSSERSRGALLGLAVGDALGAPLENRRMASPLFPTLSDGPFVEMWGNAQLGLKPGQVTSPTHLACIAALSLREYRGYDGEDLRKKYLAWAELTQMENFPEVPLLKSVLTFRPAPGAARYVWHHTGRRSAEPGALTRTVPIAVFFAKGDGAARAAAIAEDVALTHFDPCCQLASAAFGGALAAAITGAELLKPLELVNAADTAMNAAAVALTQAWPEFVQDVTYATTVLKGDLAAAQTDDPQLYGPELHLYRDTSSVRLPFRLAFWELCHAADLRAGVIDATHRGGTPALSGALTGALFGALQGEHAVPPEWREGVLGALPTERSVLRTLYHPERLLELLELDS